MIKLKGITWDHARGFNPLVGTTTAFIKENPEISIEWHKRTLAEFGDFPVEELAKRYDLLLIDHPFTGEAEKKKLYVNLAECIPQDRLEEIKRHSIGKTYESYVYDEKVLALPVDAAALVGAGRCDLLREVKLQVPKRLEDVFALAEALPEGKYIDVALCHIDIWCVMLSLCAAAQGQEFFDLETGFPLAEGVKQIETIRKLASISHHDAFSLNPIQILDRMATENDVVFSPYLFGYINYSVKGNYNHIVEFFDAPLWDEAKTSTILGGVGIAISTASENVAAAAKYVEFVTHPEIQEGLYFEEDGQPAQNNAWTSKKNNAASHNFFKNTMKTIEDAYIRPRVPGWNRFQETGSMYLWQAVQQDISGEEIIRQLNTFYKKIVRNEKG